MLEQEFLEKANDRERQILEQLQALGIDPRQNKAAAAEGDLSQALQRGGALESCARNSRHNALESSSLSKNSTYQEIMRDIEEKERQLEQMESEFKANAREELRLEEVRLSQEKQAKVDNRKQELQAMLASMQEMEKEFDELDAGFDA